MADDPRIIPVARALFALAHHGHAAWLTDADYAAYWGSLAAGPRPRFIEAARVALAAADKADYAVTRMPAEQFDRMIRALDGEAS